MKKALLVCLLLSIVGACTTERVIEPNDPKLASELNAQLGLGYIKQGQYKRAKSKLEKALEYNSDNGDAHHYMAELYRRLGELDKAEEHFERALELNEKDSTLQNNYGVFLCDRGQFEKAINHFERIIKDPLYASKSNAYENIGLCQVRQGNLQKAEAAYTRALRLNPKSATSLLGIAQMRYDRGDKRGAYDYFRRYIALAPHTPESLWLGILLENERGSKNTVASYKVLLKGKYPDSKQTELLKKLESQGKL